MGITKEEIIKINKKYGGCPLHISNLEFDLENANSEKNVYISCSHLIRGIVCGHAFLDGCKSTASEIVLRKLERENIICDEKCLARFMIRIAKKNHTIKQIEKALRKICKLKNK